MKRLMLVVSVTLFLIIMAFLGLCLVEQATVFVMGLPPETNSLFGDLFSKAASFFAR